MKEPYYIIELHQFPHIDWKHIVANYLGILFKTPTNYGVFASQRPKLTDSSADASGVKKTVRECKELVGSEK